MYSFKIDIDTNSSIPKYKQIADSITKSIFNGEIKAGAKLPSINAVSSDYDISRDTIEKAYKVLREKNIIESIRGKGYYISNILPNKEMNILFMINKPSTYKMEIYDAFVNEIGIRGHVSMFLYYCDETLFVNELKKRVDTYDYYIIMPHFRDKDSHHISYTDNVIDILEKIPKKKLIIIDNDQFRMSGEYGSIYQDFDNDIVDSLLEAKEKLSNYKKLILVFPSKDHYPYPQGIIRGFEKFCKKHLFNYEIINEVYPDMELEQKEAYIILRERDLVSLVRQVRRRKLTLAKDIGIISYNETPLKDLLGITVISTDFKAMGASAAYLLLKNKIENVKNVFKYLERDSI